MDELDHGKQGERDFAAWCNSAGIINNHSESEDKKGWDFILEITNKESSKIPIDSQFTTIQCKIQVKSTRNKKKKSIKISIKNLKALLDFVYPVFFVLISYKEEQGILKAQKISMIHMDEKIIYRTLKKIRELEKNNELTEIHKRELSITSKNSDYLKQLGGKEIKQRIVSVISGGIKKYIEWKKRILTEMGNPFVKVSFKNTDYESVATVQDHLLGYRKTIRVKDVEIVNSRFGIDLPIDKIDEVLCKLIIKLFISLISF